MQIITLTYLALGNLGFAGFLEPQAVAEPQRIALTPVVDGKFETNEWDSYSGLPGKETYFQWEPEKLFAASKLGENEDLLISVDTKSDGWLIGKSNFEFRISIQDGKPVLRARRLDTTPVTGPIWLDAPEFLRLSTVNVSLSENTAFVECSIDDSGARLLPDVASKIGVRLDIVPSGQEFEPYLPRTMTQSELVFDRGSNVPGGLRWKPNFISRNVNAGQVMNVRFHFNGASTMNLARFEVDSILTGTETGAKLSYPFPEFDKKGHVAIDFKTPIPNGAVAGYRLLRGFVTDVAGNSTILKSSYRIAPLVELTFQQPKNLKSSKKERIVKFSYFVQSNSMNRINGEASIQAPPQWKIVSGESSTFVIYHSHTGHKKSFELLIPAEATGSFPINLTTKVGEKVFQKSSWIQIR